MWCTGDLFSLCLHLSSSTLILPTCFILPTNVYHFAYIWVWLRRLRRLKTDFDWQHRMTVSYRFYHQCLPKNTHLATCCVYKHLVLTLVVIWSQPLWSLQWQLELPQLGSCSQWIQVCSEQKECQWENLLEMCMCMLWTDNVEDQWQQKMVCYWEKMLCTHTLLAKCKLRWIEWCLICQDSATLYICASVTDS